MEKKFYLYPSCIPVKGYARSIILDTCRDKYTLIPNALYSIIEEFQGCTTSQVVHEFGVENYSIINECFDFMRNKDMLYFTSNGICFNPQNEVYEVSSLISNAHIEIGLQIPYKIIDELSNLNCIVINIKFIESFSIGYVVDVLKYINQSRISCVYLSIPYSRELEEGIDSLLQTSVKIRRLVFINSPRNNEKAFGYDKRYYMFFLNKEASDNIQCGCIHPNFFTTSKGMVIEGQTKNTCFNKKIYINKDGLLKNCPYSQQILGYINKECIVDVVSKENYKFLCSITKDQVNVCKDCEFRYICMDCRVYIKDKNNIYSQPAKCNYNPYIAKWKGQDGYIPVEDWLNDNNKK